jgi:hypothetical protein
LYAASEGALSGGGAAALGGGSSSSGSSGSSSSGSSGSSGSSSRWQVQVGRVKSGKLGIHSSFVW